MSKVPFENIIVMNVRIRPGAGLNQIKALGRPGIKGMWVNLIFPGYEDDQRELFEIQEVREWFKQFLRRHAAWLPQLTRESFSVAQTCCNRSRHSESIAGQVEMQILPSWTKRCKAIGIDPQNFVPNGP